MAEEALRVKTSHLRGLNPDGFQLRVFNFGDDPPCRLATTDGEEFDFFNGKCHRGG